MLNNEKSADLLHPLLSLNVRAAKRSAVEAARWQEFYAERVRSRRTVSYLRQRAFLKGGGEALTSTAIVGGEENVVFEVEVGVEPDSAEPERAKKGKPVW